MEKKRIDYLDIAKGIGIILVLVGHISKNDEINRFLYLFHMPLFFIISGMLYKEKNNFCKKKIRNLIIPYFCFAIISYLYWLIIERKIRHQDEANPIELFLNIFLQEEETIIIYLMCHYGSCHASLQQKYFLIK